MLKKILFIALWHILVNTQNPPPPPDQRICNPNNCPLTDCCDSTDRCASSENYCWITSRCSDCPSNCCSRVGAFYQCEEQSECTQKRTKLDYLVSGIYFGTTTFVFLIIICCIRQRTIKRKEFIYKKSKEYERQHNAA